MSLIERILSYLGWCPSKKAASDFRPKMEKSLLRNPSVIIMAVAILGMLTFIYYNSTRQINYIPICVIADGIQPYIVDLAEKDINQYCEENGYSQRFNFVNREHSIGGPEETKILTDTIAREGYKLVVGYSGGIDQKNCFRRHRRTRYVFRQPTFENIHCDQLVKSILRCLSKNTLYTCNSPNGSSTWYSSPCRYTRKLLSRCTGL